jgi:hypothetical protein
MRWKNDPLRRQRWVLDSRVQELTGQRAHLLDGLHDRAQGPLEVLHLLDPVTPDESNVIRDTQAQVTEPAVRSGRHHIVVAEDSVGAAVGLDVRLQGLTRVGPEPKRHDDILGLAACLPHGLRVGLPADRLSSQ